MAHLLLLVTRYKGQPVAERMQAEFGPSGGTIGRSTGSTLLLPDADRAISRTHAVIECHDGAFVVRDQGSAVPVVLNGRPIGNGHRMPLATGDAIVIGRYELQVALDAAAGDETMVRAVVPGPERAIAPADPSPAISMSGTVLSWSEEDAPGRAESIRTVSVPSPTATDVVPATAAASATTPTTVAAPTLMAAPTSATVATVATAATAATLPLATPSPAVALAAGSGDLPARRETIANDAAVAQPPRPSPSADELLKAFLRGAGVPHLSVPGGLSPELMTQLGQMLRETVRGLLDLLAARALAKREVRADATVIVAQDNNPLKFSPGVEAAISHLLAPRGTGFMSPLRAVTDAHDSLRSHQLAFMAGMQAALTAVLVRLDPAALAGRLAHPSLVGTLLPAAHKARLWDAFVQLHAGIARDADVDFHALFGHEFLAAYQTRVSRLREQHAHDPAN